MKKKVGAPKGSGSRFTVALSEAICAEMAEGRPLRQICREKGVSWDSVYRWRKAYPDFEQRFACARERGEEALAAQCLEIADTPMEGVEITEEATAVINSDNSDGASLTVPATITKTKRSDMLGHRKLQIETRLKLLAIWNPSKYGTKVENTHNVKGPIPLRLDGSDVHG